MADVYSNPEKHVVLHNSVKMPILGLGTSHQGGYSHEAVVYALKDCGYRHIDTAKRYGCETFIAQAVQASGVPREELFLATKCWPTDYGTIMTREAFIGSCQRLGVDYVDMYLLHWPEVPSGVKNKKELLQDTWRMLEVLLDEERVRVIGVSNFLEHHLQMIMDGCSITPHVNQCEFHPYNNPKQLQAYCAERNIQFEVFDFALTEEAVITLDNMAQKLTIMDPTAIQAKIDNPLPDGYKLKLVKKPVEP